MEQPHISSPCPSCGGCTLFIGTGGWLTCSLIGCKEPTLISHTYELNKNFKKAESEREELRIKANKFEGALECVHKTVARRAKITDELKRRLEGAHAKGCDCEHVRRAGTPFSDYYDDPRCLALRRIQ